VDPADICKLYTGITQVKSRRLYFQELRDDVANKEYEKAYTVRNGIQQDDGSGYYLDDGCYRTPEGAYIVKVD
jgi:hypothetical protein